MTMQLVDFILCFIENAIVIATINLFMHPKTKYQAVIILLIMTLFAYSVNTYEDPFALILVICLLILYAIFNYAESVLRKIVIATSVFITNIAFSIICVMIMSLMDHEVIMMMETDLVTYCILTFIHKLLYYLSVLLVVKVKRKKITAYQLRSTLPEICILVIILIFVFYSFTRDYIIAHTALIIIALMIIQFLISIYRLQKFSPINLSTNENNSQGVMLDTATLHDFRNKSILLRHYLEIDNTEKALDLLDDVSLTGYYYQIYSKDEALNGYINTLCATLHTKHIMCKVSVMDDLTNLSDMDRSELICILMDMAIVSKSTSLLLKIDRFDYGVCLDIEFTHIIKNANVLLSISLDMFSDIIQRNNGECVKSVDNDRLLLKVIFFKGEVENGQVI